jgi:hypothetical protein
VKNTDPCSRCLRGQQSADVFVDKVANAYLLAALAGFVSCLIPMRKKRYFQVLLFCIDSRQYCDLRQLLPKCRRCYCYLSLYILLDREREALGLVAELQSSGSVSPTSLGTTSSSLLLPLPLSCWAQPYASRCFRSTQEVGHTCLVQKIHGPTLGLRVIIHKLEIHHPADITKDQNPSDDVFQLRKTRSQGSIF